MKHLKLFSTDSEYQRFAEEEMVLPNVSYVEDVDVVYYNPFSAEPSYVMVDLGLPSGLLWADRNIGASSPEDAGLYFAWGETQGYTAEQVANGEKAFSSDWSDYFDSNDGRTFNKYSYSSTLEASDDAAAVNMGSEYRMPNRDDCNELINNTTITFIDLQDNEFSEDEVNSNNISESNLKGVKFTGSNGNSIFIPASGVCSDSQLRQIHNSGSVWSSRVSTNYKYEAFNILFSRAGAGNVTGTTRCYGHPVRGVK